MKLQLNNSAIEEGSGAMDIGFVDDTKN